MGVEHWQHGHNPLETYLARAGRLSGSERLGSDAVQKEIYTIISPSKLHYFQTTQIHS